MEIGYDQLQSTIDEYLDVYCVECGQVESTIKHKRRLLNSYSKFLNGRPCNLETVREFQRELHATTHKEETSRDFLARAFRAFVNYCYNERELFVKNWAKKIIKPKLHRKVIEVVTESVAMEIIIAGTTPEAFENAAQRRSKGETQLALQFILLTGCRVHEVETMKGSDLRLDANDPFVYIHSKGGDTEMQPIPQTMLSILKERQNNDRLFLFTKRTANVVLRRGSKKLGIIKVKTSCHRLRDIFAITRLRNGVPLQLVSRALRHDSVKTTDRYYSNYMISDIAPVVNNSTLVKQEMTPKELLDEFMFLIKKAGLDKHEEFSLRTTMKRKGIHIDAVFRRVEKDLQ